MSKRNDGKVVFFKEKEGRREGGREGGREGKRKREGREGSRRLSSFFSSEGIKNNMIKKLFETKNKKQKQKTKQQ